MWGYARYASHRCEGGFEVVDTFTAALAASAAAGLSDVAAQAVKHAHGQLETALSGRHHGG